LVSLLAGRFDVLRRRRDIVSLWRESSVRPQLGSQDQIDTGYGGLAANPADPAADTGKRLNPRVLVMQSTQ